MNIALDNYGEAITDLKGNPMYTNKDGTITLYHRTTKTNAINILKNGFRDGKENTKEIFLSSIANGENEGYGDTVLEVKIKPRYVRVDDIFHNEIHFTTNLKYILSIKEEN